MAELSKRDSSGSVGAMNDLQPNLTPRWCASCQMFVPAEREPHRSALNPSPHYAIEREGEMPFLMRFLLWMNRRLDI